MFTVKAIKQNGAIHLYEYESINVLSDGCVVGDGAVYHYVSDHTAHSERIFVTDSNGKTVVKILHNGNGLVSVH